MWWPRPARSLNWPPSLWRTGSRRSPSDYWRIWYYLLEAAGLSVQLVNARDVKNVPGRLKTDKLDAVWLAKLTEKGLLRPSFVPPAPIREFRDYTRLRTDLIRERTRYWQRVEKLLEDSLIKVSAVASTLDTLSVRDMLEALIAGERDPRRLADLARGRMKTKRAALIKALTGRFDAHHGELARMLLDQIDALNVQITTLSTRIEELLAAMPDAQPADTAIAARCEADTAVLSAQARLDEIPGVGSHGAQVILAEIGLDMTRFPTAGHLVSWAKLSPRTIQSGPVQRGGPTGKGNPYLKGALGEAANAAAKTNTFLGERYRRIVKRRGKLKALVAVAPLHPGHHLEPAVQPRRALPRPRLRLPRHPHQHRPKATQPHHPARRDGLPRHPRTRRLTRPTTAPAHKYPAPPGAFVLPAHLGSFSGQAPRVLRGQFS